MDRKEYMKKYMKKYYQEHRTNWNDYKLKRSAQQKRDIKEYMKNYHQKHRTWNKQKSNYSTGMNPNSRNGFKKGRMVSEKTRQKLREAMNGRQFSKEVINKRSLSRILNKKGVSATAKEKIRNSLKEWYIKNRGSDLLKRKSEIISKTLKGRFAGEKNPAWLGGISFEPYNQDFNDTFKNIIKARDNFCCLNCGISEQTHILTMNRKLAVHHVDYNKKNTCLVNCCSLCLRCHVLSNKNREEWERYYKEKLNEKYGYFYSDEIQEAIDGRIKYGQS